MQGKLDYALSKPQAVAGAIVGGAAAVAQQIRCALWPAPVLSFFVIGSAGV